MERIENISFTSLHNIPPLIKDFLEERIEEFSDAHFSEIGIGDKLTSKGAFFTPQKRQILYEVLRDQHAGVQISVSQYKNLELLLSENTFTVTTGHQLNLFTGPVFFVYKILQTIKLAEFLSQSHPNNNFVPVFWMATEDHDFDEINHFSTDQDFFEIKGKSGGAVGRMMVEDQFFIGGFEREFKDSVFGTELIRMMKKAYEKGNTFAEATRILVQHLFAKFGILIIDGDDHRLKSQGKILFEEEILHQQLFGATTKNVEFLKNKYGKVQVNPREINLFYISQTRNRIQKVEDRYFVVDTSIEFSQDEILEELSLFPERFSPNAVLRPAYQETILPNIAYVGGNAEIMYWLELKDYFKAIGLPFPFLIPRSSLLMLSTKSIKKMEKFGLNIKDFLQDFANLSHRVLLEDHTIQHLLDEQENHLRLRFEKLREVAGHTDPTFSNMVSAEEQRQLKSFQRLEKRLLRAEKIKQAEKLESLESLFLQIHPSGIWQERVWNFSVFYAESGFEWLQNCYEEIHPINSELIVFSV